MFDIDMDDVWETCHALVGDPGYESWDGFDDDDPYPWLHTKPKVESKPTAPVPVEANKPLRNFSGFIF